MRCAAMLARSEASRSWRNWSREAAIASASVARPSAMAMSAASLYPRSAQKSSQYECTGLAE